MTTPSTEAHLLKEDGQEVGASAPTGPTVATHEPSPTSGLGPSGECQLAGLIVAELEKDLSIPTETIAKVYRALKRVPLVAVAPELLETVIALTRFLERTIKRAGLKDTNRAVADCKALIAKATGSAK